MSGLTTVHSARFAVVLPTLALAYAGIAIHRGPTEFGAAMHAAQITSPPSGTISGSGPTSVPFTATLRSGAATGPGDCVGVFGVSNCSQFVLTVQNPGTQNVRIRLDWGSPTNDYDLYVFKVNGTSETQVASSGNGTTTFEETVFTPTANTTTTYHVVIVHFAAAGDNITGSASLVAPPPFTNASRIGPNNTGIVFSRNGNIITTGGEAPTGKGTVFAKETVRDGEPSIRVDLFGNVYPAGIRGVPAGVDVWRFGPRAFCPQFTFYSDAGLDDFPDGQDPADGYVYLGQPDGFFPGAPDPGGGDIELAVSFPSTNSTPVLSMVSLTLANVTAAASFNRGDDWTTPNAAAPATLPPVDRQWIEAYGDRTVYLYYRSLATLTGLVLNKSIDNGQTYAVSTTLVSASGVTPGWIDVDQSPNPNGSVDIYLSAQNSTELVVFHCVDPTPTLPNTPAGPGAITCIRRTVDNTTSHGHIFDPVTVDNAGNVYAAWSNNKDIFYAYSTNKAATWSRPIKVTNAGGGGAFPNFNFFPWITAGDNGRVGIVWYGTDKTTNADNNAEWKAYYAFTSNARATTPTVRWLAASDHIIHKSNVSQAGLSTDEANNRNLIDFFQVAHDPRDGAAVIAYADDHNDFDGGTYYTRQIAGPGLGLRANRNPTAVACPALTPFRNPEVRDFAGDATTSADATVPLPDADILNVDFGSQRVGSNVFLTADILIDKLLVTPPPERSYRAYFAVNTVRGLMDAGNEYFIEVETSNPLSPRFFLGMKDRRQDGTTHEVRTTEDITLDQVGPTFVGGSPGHVRLRVKVNRLDYSLTSTTTDGTPINGGSAAPGLGHLVIGLSGRARIAIGTATSLVDETRGGSFIILGAQQDGDGDGCPDSDEGGDEPDRGDTDFDDDGRDDDCEDDDDDNDGVEDGDDDDDDNDGVDDDDDDDDDNDGISDFQEAGVVNALELLKK